MDFIRDISILIGIWVAIYGIDSWRREFYGKRQIELAEDALAVFYEASDAISYIRNPFGFSNEHESIERGEKESEEQFEARKMASTAFYRYNQHKELFSRLYSMRYRFIAAFGKEKAKPFDDLHKVVNEIFLAARMLGRLWAQEYLRNEEALEKHQKNVEKYESIFWFQGSEDTVVPRVQAIIDEIDTICRGIILGKGTLHYFINWKWRRGG